MDISADVIKILQLGLPGLVFLLMLMSFKLITRAQNKDKTVYQICKNKLAEIRAIAQKDHDDQEKI